MLNFSELQSATADLLERTDATMAAKIKTFLNDGWRYIAGVRPWMGLLRTTTFQGVAGLDYFITGQEVDQVIDISQRATPVVIALQRYYSMLQRQLDIITTTGNPSTASPAGEIGVKAALPSDGTISLVSSSASDTTQVVQIRGYATTTLMPITEEVTVNGTSAAVSTGSFTAKEGFEPKFTKSADTIGTVTISRSGTTIAELAPTEREARYKKWKVWPVFSTSLTMYLTFKKRIYKMVNAEDTPDIECDNALILFAFARGLQEKRQTAKATETFGRKDIDGTFPPGTFGAELDSLIAKEPQFSENFSDQFMPIISKESIDMPNGGTGYMLWPSS